MTSIYSVLDSPRSDKSASQKAVVEINSKKLPERAQSTQNDKYPELTVRMFFEFMRTAYQVNDSFEELSSVLANNSEIDWSELARIDLNLQSTQKEDNDKSVSRKNSISNNRRDKSIGTSVEKIPEQNNSNEFATTSSSPQISSIQNAIEETLSDTEKDSKINSTALPISGTASKFQDTQLGGKKLKNSSSEFSVEQKEHPLAKCMKKNLSDILHEGLLDSVLPYMLPKPVFSQPIIKKPIASIEPKKSASLGTNFEGKIGNVTSAGRDKDKEKSKQQRKLVE